MRHLKALTTLYLEWLLSAEKIRAAAISRPLDLPAWFWAIRIVTPNQNKHDLLRASPLAILIFLPRGCDLLLRRYSPSLSSRLLRSSSPSAYDIRSLPFLAVAARRLPSPEACAPLRAAEAEDSASSGP